MSKQEEIIAEVYDRIMAVNKSQILSLHQIEELGEIAFYTDLALKDCFAIQGHRAAGKAIRKHHENRIKAHPYADHEHLRYSPNSIVDMVYNPSRRCSCGEKHDLAIEINITTYPSFPESKSSTADRITCNKCGRVWEEAYTIVYSMCVLKNGS